MATKIDALLEQIGGLREDIGGFRADIANLKDGRGRIEHNLERLEDILERHHIDHQNAVGDVRDKTQAALGELRKSMDDRFSEQAQSIASVEQGLEEHAKKVSRIQAARGFSRTKLATLASIGLTVLAGLALCVDAAVRWAVDRILSWKFGG